MGEEELLYNQIYERTKDFGRAHFIKEIMNLERENQKLIEELNKYQCKRNCASRIKENRIKTDTEVLDELEEWLKDEKLLNGDITTQISEVISLILVKLKELKKGENKWD